MAKRLAFEPVIKATISLGDVIKKVEVTKISDSKIAKITKKYEKMKSDKDEELEELQTDLLFMLKELNAEELTAPRIRELREEIKETKDKIKQLEEETAEEREQLKEEKAKELCLAVANGNKKTISFFEEAAEQFSWHELSVILNQAFKAYEEGFLQD